MLWFDDNTYVFVLCYNWSGCIFLHSIFLQFFFLPFFFSELKITCTQVSGVWACLFFCFVSGACNWCLLSVSISFRMTVMGFPGQRRGWCGRSFIYHWRSSRMHRNGSTVMALAGASRQWTVRHLCGTAGSIVLLLCSGREGDQCIIWHTLCSFDLHRGTCFWCAWNAWAEESVCFGFWLTDWDGDQRAGGRTGTGCQSGEKEPF